MKKLLKNAMHKSINLMLILHRSYVSKVQYKTEDKDNWLSLKTQLITDNYTCYILGYTTSYYKLIYINVFTI